MLDVLPRCDQRAKGELYVRGLLTDGPRKSMQPMAQRLGVDHQGLQQFITSSTWDYQRVLANVARWAVQVDPDATAHPADAVPVTAAYSGRGRRPKPAYPEAPVTFKDLVLAAGRGGVRKLAWRQGTRATAGNQQAKLRSHFLAIRIRPANRD